MAGALLRKALVGGNLVAAAARNGWAGIVVWGCVRDVAELNAEQLGIRALGLNPMPAKAQPGAMPTWRFRLLVSVCVQAIGSMPMPLASWSVLQRFIAKFHIAKNELHWINKKCCCSKCARKPAVFRKIQH